MGTNDSSITIQAFDRLLHLASSASDRLITLSAVPESRFVQIAVQMQEQFSGMLDTSLTIRDSGGITGGSQAETASSTVGSNGTCLRSRFFPRKLSSIRMEN
ncbi:hypothetical protein NliqN6_4833 [Naganishia liquefaciens]|uniref:Uncharacterized protein n=1 Tax=Naganishia liquefaciens TaxID=104408 RepID=A0A8H3TWY9_9TREE|nr:hypothetical protein NliqN6_4833 [Naganishia liquefaciens]